MYQSDRNNVNQSFFQSAGKDYEKDIDAHGRFFAVVNWPNLELYGAFSLYDSYFGQSATIKLMHVFMIAGWWVTVDFE